MNLDSSSLTILCPTCGKSIKKTVAWFKRDGQTCPHGCGTHFISDAFRRDIDDAEKEIVKAIKDFTV